MENNNIEKTEKVDNSLSTIIQDNSGGLSSARILMLSWGLGVLAVWMVVSIIAATHGVYTFSAIPESVVTILLGVTGLKVAQRFGEK